MRSLPEALYTVIGGMLGMLIGYNLGIYWLVILCGVVLAVGMIWYLMAHYQLIKHMDELEKDVYRYHTEVRRAINWQEKFDATISIIEEPEDKPKPKPTAQTIRPGSKPSTEFYAKMREQHKKKKAV